MLLTYYDFQQNKELPRSLQLDFDPDNLFNGDRLYQAFQEKNAKQIPSGALDEDVPCPSPADTIIYNMEDEPEEWRLQHPSI